MTANQIFTWPVEHRGAVSRTFRLVSRNIVSPSLFRPRGPSYGPVDQRFVSGINYPPKDDAGWYDLDGLIAGLRGQTGFVRLSDPARSGGPMYNIIARKTPATTPWDDATAWDDGAEWLDGLLPTSVSADAAAARGDRSLPLRGFPASLRKVLRRGDLFEVQSNGIPACHGHLYIVTGTSNSDAIGKTLVNFEPGLRAGVADGDSIVITDPTSVFNLTGDDEGEITVDVNRHGRLGVSLIEVVPE